MVEPGKKEVIIRKNMINMVKKYQCFLYILLMEHYPMIIYPCYINLQKCSTDFYYNNDEEDNTICAEWISACYFIYGTL